MPPVPPSQTQRGQRWLTNFAASEQAAAALLLDSLQFASPSEIHHELTTHIRELEDHVDGYTGVLIPAVSVEDIDRALEDEYERAVTRAATLSPDEAPALPDRPAASRHTAYDTFDPGMPIPVTPGSEGAMGNLIRDLAGDRPGRERSMWLHPATGIDALYERRCRLVVLVTDYCGSGRQAAQFAATFTRNPRLRSWRSFGWLRIVVVAYAAALTARETVRETGYVDDMVVHTPAASFEDAAWTQSERAAIEDLCRTYTPHRAKHQTFGYGGSGGLFLTHTTVPNNLPYILRRNTKGWHAFLEGRTVPPDLAAELAHYEAPDRDLAAIARQANQARLGRALDSGRLSTPAGRLVAVLALIASGGQTIARLAHRLALPDSDVAALVDFLHNVGFVGDDLTITPAGRVELRHARRLDRTATANLNGSDAPYYPQSLR